MRDIFILGHRDIDIEGYYIRWIVILAEWEILEEFLKVCFTQQCFSKLAMRFLYLWLIVLDWEGDCPAPPVASLCSIQLNIGLVNDVLK